MCKMSIDLRARIFGIDVGVLLSFGAGLGSGRPVPGGVARAGRGGRAGGAPIGRLGLGRPRR